VPGVDARAVSQRSERRDHLTIMLTCGACDVEPYAWLRHVLTELAKRSPSADVTDQLPFNYAKP
jgi:hypothetical protein